MSLPGPLKLMEFPVRLPSLSRREFHLYWQRHHSPHVMHTTAFSQGIRKYLTAHAHGEVVAGLPAKFPQGTSYDGVSELWFAQVGDFTALFGHPLYPELIAPDEARFLRQDGSAALLLVREEVCIAGDADLAENGLTKLYLLLSRLPGTRPGEGSAGFGRLASLWLAQPPLRRYLQRLAISHALVDGLPDGFPPPQFDGVMEFWFESPLAMAECFADAAYRQGVAPHEPQCMDMEKVRALVARLHVIHDEYSFQPSTTQPFGFRLPE